MSQLLHLHDRPSTCRRAVRSGTRLAGAGLLAITLIASGCGDDKDDATGDDTTETTAAPATADFTAFCDDVVAADAAVSAAFNGPDDPEEAAVTAAMDAMAKVGESAPDEIKDDAQTMVTEATAMFSPESTGPTEAFETSSAATYAWVGDNCGFNAVDVTAEDYKYTGMPTALDAGTQLVTFENAGKELHEMIFVRINDDVEETTEELLALPEDEVMSKIEMKGVLFTEPGKTISSTVDLPAGRYVVVCFIPVGLTPEAAAAAQSGGAPPEGPPHFTQGMVHELDIS